MIAERAYSEQNERSEFRERSGKKTNPVLPVTKRKLVAFMETEFPMSVRVLFASCPTECLS